MYQYAASNRKDTMEYPKIDRSSIWAVIEFVEAARKQPELLTSGDAPYPKEFLDIVREIAYKEKVKAVASGATSFEDLEAEIQTIYNELDDFKSAINQDEDGQVYVSYMRLRAGLLTKMIEVKERIYNTKSMKLFQDRLLAGLDKVCTPEQRTQFMQFLEGK